MRQEAYPMLKEFMEKYPGGVHWYRAAKHCSIIDKHLNPGEEILYLFAGQKNDRIVDLFVTFCVLVTLFLEKNLFCAIIFL